MPSNIVIVDYGMGNLHSIEKKLSRFKVNVAITSNPDEIKTADKIILPGVGHFKNAMKNLKSLKLIDVLNQEVLYNKKPVLGICLGMQLMANKSEEGDTEGLGWIDAEVIKLKVKNTQKYKIPHIGWNEIMQKKQSLLMKNIPDLSEFYFVHSFHFKTNAQTDILNETEFEELFSSAIEKENIFGVQYHPEKSHDIGELLLKNFIDL